MKGKLLTIQTTEKPESGGLRVGVQELNRKEHGAILCYPGIDLRSFSARVKQLNRLGIKELILEGDSKVGKYGVIGKGCVSIVVRALRKNGSGLFALKIRRVDANRPSMKNDYDLQKLANLAGVGPRAIASTKDLFLMEYIDSVKIGKWLAQLKSRASKRYVRKLVRNALYQCYLLDSHGLDHGELSNPAKHILIRNNARGEVVIIDYESASTKRKPANLTSVAQFFLIGGGQALKIRKILGIEDKFPKTMKSSRSLVKLLHYYKASPGEESFEKVMNYINCHPTKH